MRDGPKLGSILASVSLKGSPYYLSSLLTLVWLMVIMPPSETQQIPIIKTNVVETNRVGAPKAKKKSTHRHLC